MILRVVWGVAGSVVLVLIATNAGGILSSLRRVLRDRRVVASSPGAEDERERIRRALAPITMKFDEEKWRATFGCLPDDFDREAFFHSLPKLDPPLSQSIIDERREARY